MVNRLAQSTSPYLRQHQTNPVDWYPWGSEALQKARQEKKPIFLSIGYSACHWCHVMEKESFSTKEVAEILNKDFVPIKVDREERPDLDHLYMLAIQMMSGQGGWPLNVFLTPDLKPFYGGTYFPPSANFGRPSFRDALLRVHQIYKEQYDEVRRNADQITAILTQQGRFFERREQIDTKLFVTAIDHLQKTFDEVYGGFGGAPKFFYSDGFRLFLRASRRRDEPSFRNAVEKSFSHILGGGVFDQLGGGFHRYSTDAAWRVPHFEKMLYDNALLLTALGELWSETKNLKWKLAIEATLKWVDEVMTSPDGSFFSATDADSDHEEGAYFMWTFEEVQSALSSADFQSFAQRFSLVKEGHERGKNVLIPGTPLDPSADAKFLRALENLRKLREKRTAPAVDQKILTSWNAMMISALARLGVRMNQLQWVNRATIAFEAIWRCCRKPKRLAHSSFEGRISAESFLEDYAWLARASLDLWRATQNRLYLDRSKELIEESLHFFYDHDEGGFWSTRSDQEDLLVRTKEVFDGAIPSAFHVAVSNLLAFYEETGDIRYRQFCDASLTAVLGSAEENPGGFLRLAIVIDRYFHGSAGPECAEAGCDPQSTDWLDRP